MIHRLFISFPELVTFVEEQLPANKSFTVQMVHDDYVDSDESPLQDILFADKQQFFDYCADLAGWIGTSEIKELQARIL